MSITSDTISGAKMGKFRLKRGDSAGAHKNQPAGTIPLPFGKGQQPGLGLNGFVLAGPWAFNWFFFYLIPVILDDLEQMLQDYCRGPKVTAGRKQSVPGWQQHSGLGVSPCSGGLLLFLTAQRGHSTNGGWPELGLCPAPGFGLTQNCLCPPSSLQAQGDGAHSPGGD